MIEWPIYRNFSVFSQNSGYFDQNEKGVKKCPFPQSLRFCHNWWASGGVPGVRYAEKLSALFYLHWESLWPGVGAELHDVVLPVLLPLRHAHHELVLHYLGVGHGAVGLAAVCKTVITISRVMGKYS